MSDNNSAIIVSLDEKIAKIDDRLKQISGFATVPPNVQEEKESLERQRTILITTKSRLGGDVSGQTTPPVVDKPAIEPIVMEEPKAESGGWKDETGESGKASDEVKENQPQTSNSQQPKDDGVLVPKPISGESDQAKGESAKKEEAKEDQPKFEHASWKPVDSSPAWQTVGSDSKEENKSESAEDKKEEQAEGADEDDAKAIVGSDYAVPHDEDEKFRNSDSGDGLIKAEVKSAEDADEDKPAAYEKVSDLHRESDVLNDVVGLADDIVAVFDGILEKASDNPEADYLQEVLDDFRKTIKDLEARAEKVKMNSVQKARAIKGRLKIHLETVGAEFEFSQLYSDEAKKKVADLLK